jgi:hypothetical protein
MAMNTSPTFGGPFKTGNVSIATANANRDGSGTVGTLWAAAPTDGDICEVIRIRYIVSTTAGMVRVFRDTGAGTAASRFLIHEFVVPVVTVAANVAGHSDAWHPNLKLKSGELIVVSTHNAEECDVTADGVSMTG